MGCRASGGQLGVDTDSESVGTRRASDGVGVVDGGCRAGRRRRGVASATRGPAGYDFFGPLQRRLCTSVHVPEGLDEP